MKFQTIISADILAENLDSPNWLILDCRGGIIYAQNKYNNFLEGHIPNARYYCFSGNYIPDSVVNTTIPPSNCPSGADEIKEIFRNFGFDETSQIIIYDDECSSSLANSMWLLLRSIGFNYVAVLQGGFKSWKKQGMPLNRQVDSAD